MSLSVHLDYETRATVDLKKVGSFRYGVDNDTEVLMCAVSESTPGAPVYLWISPRFIFADHYGENEAAEGLLNRADLLHSHTLFEQAVTWGQFQQGKPTPFKKEPRLDQWRDTAAVARKAALPWSLDKLGDALGLATKKDARGKALIKFFCEPDKKSGLFREPKDHVEKWETFCSYCKTDVEAEKLADQKLKPFELTGAVLESFLFDLRLNGRGIPVCVPALQNAQKIIDSVEAVVTKEFVALTGINPTQREEVRKLVGLPNMQAETVKYALDGKLFPLDAKQRRILELYAKLSFAAVKKVGSMLDCVCPDGVVRGGHLWYGTGPGRHSGRLFQPQNFKKTPPELRSVTHQVYARIAAGDGAADLSCIYGEPYELISACIRHFIHKPGTEFLDGDYSAIQARIICWLAGQADALQRFRDGKDSYKWMAARIYNVSEGAVTADQREVGKRTILGCGFQMGAPKFQSSCLEQYGLDLPIELCELAVKVFRATHDRVRSLWYQLDHDAKAAIRAPGVPVGRFTVRQLAGMKYLLMKLPSGRSIAYPRPEIVLERFGGHVATTFDDADLARSGEGEKVREQIHHWGAMPNSVHYGPVKLYGGKLAENCLGEGTEVLTKRGWIAIESVLPKDRVWDGQEWVSHEGLVCKGEQETIDFGGVQMTPEHGVFGPLGKIPAVKACIQKAQRFASLPCQDVENGAISGQT